jgi:hypothetical protein
MAILWVVAGFHCRLEVLPGLGFLSCCQHSVSEESPLHHEKDCTDDGCAAVEFGFYKLERSQDTPTMPSQALLACAFASAERDLVSTSDRLLPDNNSSSPPELPKNWLFSQRKALPPRAPSLVS